MKTEKRVKVEAPATEDTVIENTVTENTDVPAVPSKKRGRPAGSKNKKNKLIEAMPEASKKRGRPAKEVKAKRRKVTAKRVKVVKKAKRKYTKRGVGRPISKALRPERLKRLAKLAKGRGWSMTKLAEFAKVNYISLVKALEREGLKGVNHRGTNAVKVKRTRKVTAKKVKVVKKAKRGRPAKEVKAKRKYTKRVKVEAPATENTVIENTVTENTDVPAVPPKKRGRPAGSKNKLIEAMPEAPKDEAPVVVEATPTVSADETADKTVTHEGEKITTTV